MMNKVDHWEKLLTAPVVFVNVIKVQAKYDRRISTCGIIAEVGPKPILSKLAQS